LYKEVNGIEPSFSVRFPWLRVQIQSPLLATKRKNDRSGNPSGMGKHSTVWFLIKIPCFVKKKNFPEK
jgi:hypothetical protein